MVEWELFSIHFFRTVTSKGFIVFYWTSRVICGFCFRQKGSPGMPGIFAIMTFGASLGKPNQLFYACFTVDPEFNVSPFQLSSSSLNPKWCEISHQTVRWRVSRHWSPNSLLSNIKSSSASVNGRAAQGRFPLPNSWTSCLFLTAEPLLT